jgi:hypothetical protein
MVTTVSMPQIVQRRADLMAKEGIKFVTGSAGNVGGASHPLAGGMSVVNDTGTAPSAKVSLGDWICGDVKFERLKRL